MAQSSSSFQLLSLPEIFNNRFFKIPDYQRGYSWEIAPQLEDLRKDIENLFTKHYKHFTGTIVAAQRADGVFEIVDGQQRLISLVILLAEIYFSDPNRFADIFDTYVQRGGLGNETPVLETNAETKVFFQELIIDRKQPRPTIKSHSCIADAQRFFQKWISESAIDLAYTVEVVTSKLGFILYTPERTSEIGIMFEVINNRGKDLSELEKIKNYLIYFATVLGYKTLHERINQQWGVLQQNLSSAKIVSNEDENKFLRYCFLVFAEVGKNRSYYVYNELKERFPITHEKERNDEAVKFMLEFVDFITYASQSYVYFFQTGSFVSAKHPDSNGRIEKALKYLRCQPVNASIMPLYLALMNSFTQPLPQGMIEEQRVERIADLLELLEKVNMRIYILPGVSNRADSFQGSLFSMAHLFYADPQWILQSGEYLEPTMFGELAHKAGSTIFDWLELELTQLVLTKCPEKRVIEGLTISTNPGIDFYQHKYWAVRYFLACYEEEIRKGIKKRFEIKNILISREGAKDASNEYLSLEHLWARENRSNDFPSNHIVKRRLGNFVLMGLSSNISQQNYDLSEKIEKLAKPTESVEGSIDLKQVRDLQDELALANEKMLELGWVRQTKNYFQDQATIFCDIREEKMIRFALRRWAMKGERIRLFDKLDSIKARKERKEFYHYLKE